MLKRFAVAVMVFTMMSAAAIAQETETRDQRQREESQQPDEDARWQFWLKGQGQMYQNFFQAPEGTPEDDIRALFGQVGTSVGLAGALRAYGQFDYIKYDDDTLDDSNGFRVGLKLDGRSHSFDLYADQQLDRPTFDVGDVFDRADVRSLAGEYAFRFAEDWQLSIDGEAQEQEYDLTPGRDNEFGALGMAIRWRGLRQFSPEVGFRSGRRDVDDETFSYDQRDMYVQVRSSLSSRVYLSVRYRDRLREYDTSEVTSSNFDREDKRKQISGALDWTLTRSLIWNFYAAHEKSDTNVPERDFDTSMFITGLTLRF